MKTSPNSEKISDNFSMASEAIGKLTRALAVELGNPAIKINFLARSLKCSGKPTLSVSIYISGKKKFYKDAESLLKDVVLIGDEKKRRLVTEAELLRARLTEIEATLTQGGQQ